MYRAQPKDGPAWVTGASSGIGRAVALELARRGYQVAVTARRRAELESLAAESDRIFSFPGDTTDRAGQAKLVQEIESKLGGIALAFLNAGAYFIGERTEFSADLVWRTFEINVGGTVNSLAPLLAAMKRRGRGQIALNSSLAGYGARKSSGMPTRRSRRKRACPRKSLPISRPISDPTTCSQTKPPFMIS